MGMVRIDVGGMCEVVRGLEQGIATLTDARLVLRSTLDRFDLDPTRSWGIQPAVDWAWAELPGVRRRLALAQALEGSNPCWPTGTVELDDEVGLSSMEPGEAEAAGRELALSLLDGSGKPTEAQIALLEQMGDDPYFASGFAHAVTADELAGIITGLSQERTDRSQCVDEQEWTDRNAWYGRVVVGMSTTLGTATRATGDLALPPGYGQSWVEVMTAEVQSGLFPDGVGVADHANALGLLLGSGRFSLAFTGTVADGVYDYEREFQENYPGGVWDQRRGDPGTGRVVYDLNGVEFYDPMAGVMAALGKDPAAAQNFFAGGDTVTVRIDGQDLVVSDRLKYLVCDRSWAVDPSNGGSLGQALVAATTVFRDRAGTGMVSAQIASQTFALIGEKTGEDGGGWQMPDGMVPHVAQMLSAYGTDVFRAVVMDTDHLEDGWAQLDGPGAVALFPDGLAYGAVLDADLLERLVGRIGADTNPVVLDEYGRIIPGSVNPDGENVTQTTSVQILMSGVTVASQLAITTKLDEAVAKVPNAPVDLMRGGRVPAVNDSLRNAASVMGWVVDAAFTGAKDDEAEAAAHDKLFTDALNAIMALPYLKLGEPIAQWALDQGRLAAVRSIQAGAPVEATEAIEGIDEELPGAASNMVMNLLLKAGYLEPWVFDAANVEANGEQYVAPDREDGGFVIPGDPPVFDLESDAYTYWLQSNGPLGLLQDRVVVPYKDQYTHVD